MAARPRPATATAKKAPAKAKAVQLAAAEVKTATADLEAKGEAQMQEEEEGGEGEKAAEGGVSSDEKAKEAAFPALSAEAMAAGRQQYMRIPVPPHRLAPLKSSWTELYKPIVEHMKLQVRFNPKKKCIELRTSSTTENPGAMQKSVDFLRAFLLGFAIRDAIALLRLDDLFVDSFEIKDVKTLSGEHLSRAIGRIAGQGGKTKFTIENATKTRIVLADTHIHVLGSYANINIAKSSIVRLIMGSPPGKVYTQMRNVANRMKERF